MNSQANFQACWKIIPLSILICFLLGALPGCTILALQKNVEIYEQHVRLGGQLRNPSPQNKPVIVLLYQILNKKKRILTYHIYHNPDRFQFSVMPGEYFLAAFQDANQDLIFQDSEWAAHYGSPSVISVKPDQSQLDLDIILLPPGHAELEKFPNLASHATQAKLQLPKIRFGEIVKLDDRRFTREMGQLGLWEPLRFIQQVGGGLYFLEHFDPKKIPVLFIHGASGTPQSWVPIIERMDRETFQPWLFSYASGLYLDDVTKFLRQAMSQMYLSYKFKKFIIVAHSMGGLIARSAVNLAVQKGREHEIPRLLVTISTPWGGHQGAQNALDYSPIGIIPSWVDLAPESSFQKKLFEIQLPSTVDHYLFFSYKGGLNIFSDVSNDGVVTLASQLKINVQNSAKKILGFKEDHASILTSQDMIAALNRILKTF